MIAPGLQALGIEIEDVVAVMKVGEESSLKHQILHSLMDGIIDADRADYIPRDSRHMGLPYGEGVDVDRIVDCLQVVYESGSEPHRHGTATIGVNDKGRISAESLAFARYAMFYSRTGTTQIGS